MQSLANGGLSSDTAYAQMLDYVDMDGAALLAEDIATGVVVERGICRYPQANGSGVQLTAS